MFRTLYGDVPLAMPAAISFDEAGPTAGLGLGWVTTAGNGVQPMLNAKSGSRAGYMSYTAFVPRRGVGISVAVNRVDFGAFSGMATIANGLVASLATR